MRDIQYHTESFDKTVKIMTMLGMRSDDFIDTYLKVYASLESERWVEWHRRIGRKR